VTEIIYYLYSLV